MDKDKEYILVSQKQAEAITTFFDDTTEDILFWGAARWWKSEAVGIILAICIAYLPWSEWLISRTQLADLKATTLATFFSVIKRFWYWDASYRDKIRDERHIEFTNESKLFVIQTNLEPSDPEFDRIGSYGYTWGFLDEGQQMSNKVREVLQGRLSKKRWVFPRTISDKKIANITNIWGKMNGQVQLYIVKHVLSLNQEEEVHNKILALEGLLKNEEDLERIKDISKQIEVEKADLERIKAIKKEKFIQTVLENGRMHYISEIKSIIIPYTVVWKKKQWDDTVFTMEWKFKGCVLTWCNPWTNFTRTDFYKPFKAGTLPYYRKFIPSRVVDNPWVDREYIEWLERLPETSIRKQRLLYGNFDFDDNPWILFDYNTLEKAFTREKEKGVGEIYISVDAARQGKDTTTIGIWVDLDLIESITIEKGKLTNQAEYIMSLCEKYEIDPETNVIVDEVGVGWGLVDMLGCIGFVGNHSALQPFESKYLSWKKRNYFNLRTQAFYYLQRYIGKISIRASEDVKQEIIEELLTIKEKNVVDDTKLQIIPKSEMKADLWRSPDKADMISMRMWWLIKRDYELPEQQEEMVVQKVDELWDYIVREDLKNEEEVDLDVYA